MNKKNFMILSLISFLAGLFFVITSKIGVTANVIGVSFSKTLNDGIGISLLFVSIILLFVGGLEKRIKNEDPESIIKAGLDKDYGPVSREDAYKIYNESNQRVESGEWIELGVERVRSSTNPNYPHETSLCRCWGPAEYLGSSKKHLENLFKKGKIGKTHELVLGSEKYKPDGSLHEGTVSIPPLGSRVSHRHWEIAQMYRYRKK